MNRSDLMQLEKAEINGRPTAEVERVKVRVLPDGRMNRRDAASAGAHGKYGVPGFGR